MWYLAEARFRKIDEKKTLVNGYEFMIRDLDSDNPAEELRMALERKLDNDLAIVGDPQIMVTGPYLNAEEAMKNTEDPNVTFGED
jgi:hypothetical protein